VGGSSNFRNIPDVAMTGNLVWVIYFNGQSGSFEGTSCAAPLWAGFAALINQNAAIYGRPPVGFMNPAFYSVAQSAQYTNCFHDTTNGNNTWPGQPFSYTAAIGYDLCTGLGSPNGQALINALLTFGGAVYVDLNYGGGVKNGNYLTPFNTLSQGTNAVPNGGTIVFETAATTSDAPTIKKPMQFIAIGGQVTIGH